MPVDLVDSSEPMETRTPVLLLPRPGGDALDDLGLPKPSDNLFKRIIRDPMGRDRLAQERRCAEMLCAMLINCPTLSKHLLRWLADLTGCPGVLVDKLQWRFETEQSIEGKRDDLRISGITPGDETLTVLWTIEIKVGATFHESTPVFADDAEEEDEARTLVNQLVNYDAWLRRLL